MIRLFTLLGDCFERFTHSIKRTAEKSRTTGLLFASVIIHFMTEVKVMAMTVVEAES